MTMCMKMTQMSMLTPRIPLLLGHREPEKAVVVMGATGTGKSRLSVDLATKFGGGEIINSDKMQVYRGLDIVTNKATVEELRGVPHHLMGFADPTSDFSSAAFCNLATAAAEGISSRGKLLIIAYGSNSFLEALVDGEDSEFRRRFQCCFLWVDAAMPVLYSFVASRINVMVERRMVQEVSEIFNPNCADYSIGIRRSIRVPELDQFLRCRPFCDSETQAMLLKEALRLMVQNTRKLTNRQREKILRPRFHRSSQ